MTIDDSVPTGRNLADDLMKSGRAAYAAHGQKDLAAAALFRGTH